MTHVNKGGSPSLALVPSSSVFSTLGYIGQMISVSSVHPVPSTTFPPLSY